MNTEADELIEMLRDAREYTKFVGEMGVETVDDLAATIDSTSTHTEPSPRFQRSVPARTSAATEALLINHPGSAKASTPLAAASADSLFGDVAEPQTTLSPSAETLSDIWTKLAIAPVADCVKAERRLLTLMEIQKLA